MPHWFRRYLPLVFVMVAPLLGAERIEQSLSGSGWHLWRDTQATWRDDTLYFPAPDVSRLPVHPPSGGWSALAGGVAVSVPGTVEQYLQTVGGPEGDLVGVSWWSRTIHVPTYAPGSRVRLLFGAVRQRAEVFVNRALVGYEIVGNSPFEVDVTDHVRPGAVVELAVRITDPAGNFDWRDSQAMRWGRYALPLSHGFGGISGEVRLVVSDAVYIDDLYLQNQPGITEAVAWVTVKNTGTRTVRREVRVEVTRADTPEVIVTAATPIGVTLPPGETRVSLPLSAPGAAPWTLESPILHRAHATLVEGAAPGDAVSQRFGFRWFGATGVGDDAVLRLNGKRIVLRTAISWGFWPIAGLFPSPELAEKEVRTAKELGLTMLNFHRAIGHPVVLDEADEQGLLFWEEPGAYKSVTNDPWGHALAREKWLRMVKRDRSHPSLVIYTLINEWDSRNPKPNPVEIARHRDDLAAAHALDPSRLVLHTSAWARAPEIEDPAKLHFRPFDDRAYLNGWYDVHHAGGPATWNESLYRSPDDYYLRTTNRKEVVFWGEEGALSTPPRLTRIEQSLRSAPQLGWDGAVYRTWFRTFDAFLDEKGLRGAFPTVDGFTQTMGNVSFEHQGRRIENVRLGNVGDGYAINGWESELIENHSGIVDCFRNPKGDPAILAYYNQPLYVAVKVRDSVVQAPAEVRVDLFAINERDLRGEHRLRVIVRDAQGAEIATQTRTVTLTGGDTYGEALAEDVRLGVPAGTRGTLTVEASLVDAHGAERARGRDHVVAVDWRATPLRGRGAVWEDGARVRTFLENEKGLTVPTFVRGLDRLDWLVVARGPAAGGASPIPLGALHTENGEPGLRATFYSDPAGRHELLSRTDAGVRYVVEDGAAPDPALSVLNNYTVVWRGRLTAPGTGDYGWRVRSTGATRLLIDGVPVLQGEPAKEARVATGTSRLRAGQTLEVRLEMTQGRGTAECEWEWVPPDADPGLADDVLARVRRDGTVLILVDRAEAWMAELAAGSGGTVRYDGAFKVGRTWLGGVHFAKADPLFAGLPSDGALDWPYQAVVRNGNDRLGLRLHGDTLAAGCYHSYPMELGSVVGHFAWGRGRVIYSTLDILGNLSSNEGPAQVARALLVNYVAEAARLRVESLPPAKE